MVPCHGRNYLTSHHLQIAEYAVSMGVDHEPGFNWWVPHTLKKRDAIIALVKKRSARYLKRTHKFGIECPNPVENAIERSTATNWIPICPMSYDL